MGEGLRRGYATTSTDTGHTGGSASFGMGHPEKVIDFAYRSEHEMTVTAKAVVNAFYASAPKYSYWQGCSAGGRQAMKEAQMFPADFDGIIAGSPGLDWSGRTSQAVRIAQALQNEAARLPAAKTQVLHAAVVNACDAHDGVKDGLIENPAACKFDPGVLACKAGDEASCLTAAQVETARLIYSPIVDAKTKREIPGLAPGSELGWTDMGWSASARATGLDHFRYLVFSDPQWDVQKFNVATDVARLTEGPSGAVDARDANLKPFFDRGGKLLQYHGWADPQITPLNSTAYYNAVANSARRRVEGPRLLPALHGAGYGALRRRRRAERLRRADRARAVGRAGKGAGPDRRVACAGTGRSIARVRSARIRRSPATRAAAASTRPRTSFASSRSRGATCRRRAAACRRASVRRCDAVADLSHGGRSPPCGRHGGRVSAHAAHGGREA